MKLLIIPDVHGRDFWMEPCKQIDKFDKVIFLGDYHDPYLFQVSQDKSRHRLRDQLVPFVNEHKDKVVCLMGNHEGNYVIGEMTDRMDMFHSDEIRNLLKQMDLKLAYMEDGYLFTHSGILPAWLDYNKLTLEDVLDNNVPVEALIQVSARRGGSASCGSCIWGDVFEYDMNQKLKDIFQIFGHTQSISPIFAPYWACLDCRMAFVLDTVSKELKPYDGTSI